MKDIQYKITEALVEHSSEVCSLLRRCIIEVCLPDYGNDEKIKKKWLENKTPKNIAKWIKNSSNYSFIACYRANIVGFSLINSQGDILLNYLLPEYLHQGIGKSLLRRMEKTSIANHIAQIKVNSTITAKEFYMRNAFVINGEPIKVGNYIGEFPMIKNICC